MFTRIQSLGEQNLGDEKWAWSTGVIPFFSQTPRMSIVSDALSSTDSDAEEDRPRRLRRVETRRQLTKTMSKARRGWLRVANWSYEREWRKERKAAFDPIVVYVGTAHMAEVHCDCWQCPCKHDMR